MSVETLQVYVKLLSPPSSAPSTLSDVVIPVTGLGVAAAGMATVGVHCGTGEFGTTAEVDASPKASRVTTR